MERILVVDDEKAITDICRRILSSKGYAVETAATGDEALALLEKTPCDLALADLRMPSMDGLELLRRLKKQYPNMEVVIVTAEVTIQTAIETLTIGAFDYVLKPFNLTELLSTVKRALEYAHLRQTENIFRETTYLYQLAHEINRTHSKEDLLAFILERAVKVLNSDTGTIMMHIPETGTLKLMAAIGTSAPLGSEVKLGDRISGWVAQNRKSLLLLDPGDLPQFKGWTANKDIVSSIVVPLVKHDLLLGVINLNRSAGASAVKFTERDLESLELFAIHASLIIALSHENQLPQIDTDE